MIKLINSLNIQFRDFTFSVSNSFSLSLLIHLGYLAVFLFMEIFIKEKVTGRKTELIFFFFTA